MGLIRRQAPEIARDVAARSAVIFALAGAHDHWSQEEQVCIAEGRYIEAEGAHEFALLCLRAYRSELDDPEPAERWPE